MAAVIQEEDGFWKEVLDAFFEDFMALLFPEVHAGIDWTSGFTARDKELTKLNPDNQTGRRFVDKLIEVNRRDGEAALVMIHIEVQSQSDASFSQRMFTYHYRILDRYGPPIVSLALLADVDSAWRPSSFNTDLWGCGLIFYFPMVKLLDLREDVEKLEASSNLFALLVRAILKAQETATSTPKDVLERGRWKLHAFRSLYERGVSRRKIRQLVRFVDWVVHLPDELESQLLVELAKTKGEKHMTYVTSYERIGIKRGMEKGRLSNARESILDALDVRFGFVPDAVIAAVEQVDDVLVCKKLLAEAIRAASMEDFAALLAME